MVFWRVELKFTWRNPTFLFFRKIFEMERFALLEAIFGMMPNLTVHMKPKWPPVLVALDTDDHHTKKQGTVKSPSSWARPKPCRLYKYILAIKRLPKVLRNFDQYLKEDYPEKVKRITEGEKKELCFAFNLSSHESVFPYDRFGLNRKIKETTKAKFSDEGSFIFRSCHDSLCTDPLHSGFSLRGYSHDQRPV